MKYILLIALIVGGGYYYHRYTTTQDNSQALALLLDEVVEQGSVDLFDLKDANVKRIYAICAQNEEMLLGSGRTVSDCMQAHDVKRAECEEVIFRLAPLTIDSREDLLDYTKRYLRCTLPYKDLKYQSY
ncbi:hypothetical protein V1358_01535 [Pseudoalteromonas sp. YIC-656]|uniref:hypothetical protein n=1 Tax=Pseudoalteromonas pernae TaxID=3118054 RepID=UPI00324279DB